MEHVSVCPLCEAACGIVVQTDGNQVRSVRGDHDDRFSRGYVCPKASALVDLHHDPDRIRAPLVRVGSQWREVSWEDALDRAADGLRRARKQHGRNALGLYYGNPVAHNLGLMTHGLPFVRALRTRNVYSASSADQLPQMLTALRMFGHFALIPVPDLDRTDFFLILGANPVVSNGSLMTAPGMPRRLRDIRARGGQVVVVDPRRTETASVADEHIAIRPGTDALLLGAMLNVIFGQQMVRTGRFANRIRNLERVEALAQELSPERVAGRTGVPANTIRTLATRFARTPRAACYGRVGLCTQRYGTLATWLVQVLNLVTGHLDDVGGMMIPTPAIDGIGLLDRLGQRGTFARWRSGVRQLPEFGGELPVATLADEIESPDAGGIRALLTIAGNPVLSAPNGGRLDRVLHGLDHMVSIDPYLNETTRHAHILLPPASPLSRAHYDVALSAFAVRNVAKYAEPIVPRLPSERHDWEIISELGGRLLAPPMLRRLTSRAARALHPERLVDALLRLGPHKLTLARLRQSPHGVDLGPLQPGEMARRIATADGAIDAAPDDLLQEAWKRLLPEADEPLSDGLLLVGRRHLQDNNSWMHNVKRVLTGPDRCTVLIHPADAAPRHLKTGDIATVTSPAGSVTVPVVVTDDMRVGVVSLPHGWGHDREGTRLTIASGRAGASVNDVTSDRELDTVTANAAFNGVAVTVRRIAAP